MSDLTSARAVNPQFTASPELLLRAQAIKVVFFDVDGVLTDGGLYFGPEGEQLKRFNTLDGHGLKMLQAAGVVPAVVSGRDSPALRVRLAALGVTHTVLGTEDKLPAAERILQELGLNWDAAAVMGDDWPDLPLLRRAALACVPSGGHVECLALAHWVPQALAGHGAARELCDVVVLASGHYRRLLEQAAR